MLMSRAFAVVEFEAHVFGAVRLTPVPGRGLSAFLNSFLGLRECEAAAVDRGSEEKTCISYAPQEPEIHSVTRLVSCAGCVCVSQGFECVQGVFDITRRF